MNAHRGPVLSTVSSMALERAGLGAIRDKVIAGERLSFEDGVALFEAEDFTAVGALANLVRERLHGDVTYFNRNLHINATNVCGVRPVSFVVSHDSRRGIHRLTPCRWIKPSVGYGRYEKRL